MLVFLGASMGVSGFFKGYCRGVDGEGFGFGV